MRFEKCLLHSGARFAVQRVQLYCLSISLHTNKDLIAFSSLKKKKKTKETK